MITVKLSEPVDADGTEDLMIGYLDFLKSQFEVKESAGYGKGHTMESWPKAKGVIDYWKDSAGLEYKVKAWADGNYLAVLLVYGAKEYPNINVQEIFLNGFRFKGQ